MKKTQKVYFNDAQQRVMFRQAHTSVVIGGRRLGKSHGIVAPFALRNVQRMPGGTHAFVASSFQQAFTRTLPVQLQLGRVGATNAMYITILMFVRQSLQILKNLLLSQKNTIILLAGTMVLYSQ